MNIALMVIGISALFIYAIVRRKREYRPISNGDDKIDAANADDFIEMEDVFFEKMQNGSSEIRFLNIYSQYDLMLIKSLFQSEGIPYRTEFEYMSKAKSGIHMNGQNNVYLFILKEDVNDAIDVVTDYLESKQIENNDKKENLHKVRNIAEFAIGGWAAPSPQYSKGIDILVQKTSIQNVGTE